MTTHRIALLSLLAAVTAVLVGEPDSIANSQFVDRDLRFSGNAAAENGGAAYFDGSNGGKVNPTIGNSTFSGNLTLANGGALAAFLGDGSSVSYGNVTVSGNRAQTRGGGVYHAANSGAATIAMTNATFTGNLGMQDNGAIFDDVCGAAVTSTLTNVILCGDGGGLGPNEVLFNCDTPTFKNSVLYGSGGSGGSWNGAVYKTDGGGNLAGDPQLGPLQDNGGAAPTHMPGSSSPAVNAGLDSACSAAPVSARDQRGLTRPVGAHCDAGAVEAARVSLNISDGSGYGLYGKTTQYVVTLQNLSSTDAVGNISLRGLASSALDAPNTTWFCTVGNCTTTQSNGAFADVASLAPSGTLTWLVSIPVLDGSNAASATMTIHSNAASTAADTDTLAIFRGTFDGS